MNKLIRALRFHPFSMNGPAFFLFLHASSPAGHTSPIRFKLRVFPMFVSTPEPL